MLRRHPALSVVAVVYFGGLVLVCLTPNTLVERAGAALGRAVPWGTATGAELTLGVLLFVPMGVLLVLITGRRRWVAVLVVGIVACCWLRLAELVMLTRETGEPDSVMPHIVGTAVGIALAVTAIAVRRRAAVPAAAVAQRP